MSSAKASVTGTLGSTPLSNLLVYALDKKLHGTFVFELAGQRSAFSVRDGMPFKAKLSETVARLGDVLVEQGLQSQDRDEGVERALHEKRPLGSVLIAQGAIDVDRLCQGLGEQLCRKAEWLAKLPVETVFGFYPHQDLLARYGGSEPPAVDPLAVIWRVARLTGIERIESTLARLGQVPMRMHRYARPGRFGFGTLEQSVVDVLRAKAHRIDDLFKAGILPDSDLKKVLFTLAITRSLDLGGDALPVGVRAPSKISGEPPRPSGAPYAQTPVPASERASKASSVRAPARSITPADPVPASDSPDVVAFKDEIRQRAQSVGKVTYYEILGVDRQASTSTISAAFFDLAKRWHPDRLGSQYADVRGEAMRVFSRMTEAHQVLSNDERRQEYERLIKEGGATDDEQEKVQKVLRAATAFQKAEVLVRRGNYAEAEKEAKKACEGDPDQAEYIALYADVLSVKPGRESYDDVLKMVNRARQLQPDNVRVHSYRARILKRSGDVAGALREYHWIAERDPNNVEAAREVRLQRMREQKGPLQATASEPKGGLLNQDIGQIFGKFFKR